MPKFKRIDGVYVEAAQVTLPGSSGDNAFLDWIEEVGLQNSLRSTVHGNWAITDNSLLYGTVVRPLDWIVLGENGRVAAVYRDADFHGRYKPVAKDAAGDDMNPAQKHHREVLDKQQVKRDADAKQRESDRWMDPKVPGSCLLSDKEVAQIDGALSMAVAKVTTAQAEQALGEARLAVALMLHSTAPIIFHAALALKLRLDIIEKALKP
jgi:hypothetical protein